MFPTEGLRYRLIVQAGQPSFYLRNPTGKEYDGPVEIWAGIYDRQRALLDIFSSGPIELSANPELEEGPILPPNSPIVATTATGYRLILWLYRTSPALAPTMSFRMDSPKSDRLSHETSDFAIKFAIIPEEIGFELLNKSPLPIRILWDECAYIDPSGRSFRVLHEGVRFIDRDKPMASTVVPPGASVRDLVYPTAYVSWTGSGWRQEPIFDIRGIGPLSFGVFLTLEIGGQKRSLTYKFAAVNGWPEHIKLLFVP